MAFFWTFLNVGSPILFHAQFLRWRASQGFVGIHWGPWDEKSTGVSINFNALRSNKLEQKISYLETGVSAYDLQPWVWIILLGFGPFISACILTQFLYVGV